MHRLIAAVTVGAACLGHAQAVAPFYSNYGGLATPSAVGLDTGIVAGNGAAAPPGYSWSEVANDSPYTANATAGFAGYRVTSPANGGWRLCDSFTVASGEQFDIDMLSLFGYRTDSGPGETPFTGVNLRIWRGRPGDGGAQVVFGDTTTNRLIASYNTSFYRIFNTVVDPDGPAGPGVADTRRLIRELVVSCDVTLGPGDYWIDFQALMQQSSQTGFFPTITVPGTRTLPGWNARQFTNGSTNPPAPPGWQDALDAGIAAAGYPAPPAVAQDFPFQLYGDYIPEPATALLVALGVLLRRR
jgi:hypothetical protein